MDQPSNIRDAHGRFVPGNPGGPGRTRGRTSALRRAAEQAVTPDHLAAIMRKATRLALEGNLAAMRIVMERTCGKPAEAPAAGGEPLGITLPKLETAADCTAALDCVIAGICRGDIEREAGKLLIDAVQARVRAIEATDLEARLGELEQAAGMSQRRGSR